MSFSITRSARGNDLVLTDWAFRQPSVTRMSEFLFWSHDVDLMCRFLRLTVPEQNLSCAVALCTCCSKYLFCDYHSRKKQSPGCYCCSLFVCYGRRQPILSTLEARPPWLLVFKLTGKSHFVLDVGAGAVMTWIRFDGLHACAGGISLSVHSTLGSTVFILHCFEAPVIPACAMTAN